MITTRAPDGANKDNGNKDNINKDNGNEYNINKDNGNKDNSKKGNDMKTATTKKSDNSLPGLTKFEAVSWYWKMCNPVAKGGHTIHEKINFERSQMSRGFLLFLTSQLR